MGNVEGGGSGWGVLLIRYFATVITACYLCCSGAALCLLLLGDTSCRVLRDWCMTYGGSAWRLLDFVTAVPCLRSRLLSRFGVDRLGGVGAVEDSVRQSSTASPSTCWVLVMMRWMTKDSATCRLLSSGGMMKMRAESPGSPYRRVRHPVS